jgi:hypothetical protein
MPHESSTESAKKAAGRRNARQSLRTKVTAQKVSAVAAIARMAQRPPVWSNSFVSHSCWPIHCPLAESKNSARAMYGSSGVTAKVPATATKIASGIRSCDHQ